MLSFQRLYGTYKYIIIQRLSILPTLQNPFSYSQAACLTHPRQSTTEGAALLNKEFAANATTCPVSF